jgi:hypothetical protein
MFTSENITNPSTESTITTMSIADFFAKHNVAQVNKTVATNTNGYPFVTFINKDNVAENVYFGKKDAIKYPKDTPIAKGFFNTLQIAETKNADGEIRMKLCSKGAGNRLDVADLL